LLRLLSSSSSPLGLGFESDEDKNDVFDLLSQLLPPLSADHHHQQQQGDSGASLPSPSSSQGFLLPTPTQKSTLFKTDPDLEILYTQLVKPGVLTEQEFWKPRQQQLLHLLQQQQQSSTTTTTSRKQRQGISSALPDVRPSIDGQTDKVTFTITPEIIQMIFAEQPEVHRAYLANVPYAMSEVAFWETYCKWELKKQAKRRRASKEGKTLITAAEAAAMEKSIEEDMLFAPHRRAIASVEAQRAKRQAKMVDPGVDLAADAAEYYGGGGLSGFGSGGRGNGSEDILINKSNNNRGQGGGGWGLSSTMTGHNNNEEEYHDEGPRTIAAQINRHAALVLQESEGGGMLASAEDIKGKDTAAIAAQLARAQAGMALGDKSGGNNSSSSSKRMHSGSVNLSVPDVDTVDAGLRKLWKERAASGLEDLNDDNDNALGGGRRKKGQEAMGLWHPQTYFQTNDEKDMEDMEEEQEEDVVVSLQKKKKMKSRNTAVTRDSMQNILCRIQPNNLHLAPPPPSTAAAVLLELSGGGQVDQALMKEFGPAAADALTHDPREVLPGVMVDFFRGEALKVNELLRHLWACIPINVGSNVRKEKGKRLVRAAQRIEVELQAHIKANAGANEQVVIAQMVRPLLQALRAGVETWQREEVAAVAAAVA